MVFVRPTNNKLVDRSIRFIRLLLEDEGLSPLTYEDVSRSFEEFEHSRADEPVVVRTFERLRARKSYWLNLQSTRSTSPRIGSRAVATPDESFLNGGQTPPSASSRRERMRRDPHFETDVVEHPPFGGRHQLLVA